MEETKIALLGLGLMGSGMANRLLDAGYPLSVWNRNPDKTQPLAARGATVAKSPRQAAAGASVVLSIAVGCPGMPGRVVGSRRSDPGYGPGSRPSGVQHGDRRVDS